MAHEANQHPDRGSLKQQFERCLKQPKRTSTIEEADAILIDRLGYQEWARLNEGQLTPGRTGRLNRR